MTYETYQIPEKHLRILQKSKAVKLTREFVRKHGIEPPANVKAGFMDISEEEYNKYRDVFFAVDFCSGTSNESAIVNVPWERPTTRYNEFVQCVYNVTDIYHETQLLKTIYQASTDPTLRIGYMEIDGVPVTPCTGYTFSTIGTHRVDFLLKDSSTLSGVRFSNNVSLREITLPYSLDSLGGYVFQNCYGIVKITSLAKNAPTCELLRNGQDFLGINKYGTLHVPKGSVESYNSWMIIRGDPYCSLGDQEWTVIEMDE